MSGDGLDRAHPLRRSMGELALLGAAHAAGWLDFEHAEGRDWLERALSLGRQLPPGAVLADPVCLQAVISRLEAFSRAIEAAGGSPSGERDWIRPVRAQGDLREAVTSALATLHHAAMPVWARGEAPPWEGFVAPEREGEEVSEGAG